MTLNSKKTDPKKKDDTEEYNNINIDLNDIPFNKEQDNFIIAISGKTFEILYNMNQKYELDEKTDSIMRNTQKEMSPSKLSLKPFHEAFRLILRNCSVYARCSPDNKTQLVQSLQKEGFQVLMCGDGANDCGALKAADVGVSLSQEEASIAAPFTSTNPDISCIIDVLNQGKCALVTSVEIFKYMIAFSLTEFISMAIMMISDTFLFDFQSIVIDCFITLPLCTFLPMTQAYERFNYHRPFSTLASFPVFISIFFQVILNGVFQFFGFFIMNIIFPESSFKTERKCKEGEDKLPCLDNSIIFYISFCQYLFVGLVLITAAPFKKRIYTNIPLFIFVILCFTYVFYIMFYLDIFSEKKLKILSFPDENEEIRKKLNIGINFKYYVMVYCILNFLICLFFEKVIVAYLIKIWSKKQYKKNEKTLRKTDIEPTLNLINDVKNYVREHEKKRKKKK